MTRPSSAAAADTQSPRDAAPLAARARLAVALLFVLSGLVWGGWLSRVPDVKSRLGLADDAWGLLSIGGSIGSLVAMAAVAAAIARVGPRRLSLVAAPLLLVVAPVIAAAPGPAALAAGLVAFGLSAGMLQAPMNSQAVAVERRYDRPIMSTFHACWSVGTLAGGLLGVLSVRAGAPPWLQLAVTSGVLAVALVLSHRWLPPDEPAEAGPRGGRLRRPPRALLLLAAIAMCSSVVEGAAAQWSALYTAEALGAGEAAGAATYSAFALTMTAGRMFGDRLAQVLGRVRFVQVSAAVAGTGLAVGLATGTVAGAMVGFAVLGAGAACVMPTVFSLAAAQPGLHEGESISTMAIATWPAFLIAPPVIGAVSAATSLRVALLVVVVAAFAIVLMATRIRLPEGAEGSAAND